MGYGQKNVGTKDNPVYIPENASVTDIANAKNQAREDEVRSMFEEILGIYKPGGDYLKSGLTQIETQKTKDIASATQGLISSGLYGSTMTAALPSSWESNVGTQARQTLEDQRISAYTGALQNYGSWITAIEDESPSYETIANLTQAASSAPSSSGDSWLSPYFSGGSKSLFGSGTNSTSSSKDVSSLYGGYSSAWAQQQAANLAALRKQYGYTV